VLPVKARPIWLDRASARRENDALVRVENENSALDSAPGKDRREHRAPILNLDEKRVLDSAPGKTLGCSR
jgi:hypothetical protein